MCPLPFNELTGITLAQSVLAFRRQDEVLKEAEQFRLECEALKAEQDNSPVDSSRLGWLHQLLSTLGHRHQKAKPAMTKTAGTRV